MILYLFFAIILMIALYMGLRWLAYSDVGAVKKFLKWVLIGIGGIGGLFLLLTGKIVSVFAALPLLYIWFGRLQNVLFLSRLFKNLFGRGPDVKYDPGSTHKARPHTGTTMTREEALDILGLEEGATRPEIKAAYHRLISQHHPDKGGTDYLASKINQARDVLLNS